MSPGKWTRRALMASVMLVAFASHVLIPPGFMPASGRPFSIEICPEGFPADLLAQAEPAHADSMGMEPMDMDSMAAAPMPAHSMAHRGSHPGPQHHHHHGSPSPSEHCVFGSACGAGPIPHLPWLGDFSPDEPFRAMAFASIALAVQVVHLPPPRAPPSRLS